MPLKLYPPRKEGQNQRIRGTYLGTHVNRSSGSPRRDISLKVLRETEELIERGRFSRSSKVTFAREALAYVNAGGQERFIRPLVRHFGDTPLEDIDQTAIDGAAMTLYPNASAATRNRQVYTPISAVLRRAGITMVLRRPKGSGGRRLSGWLWPEQAWPLLEEAGKLDAEFGLFCSFLLFTGERLTEPLKMRCHDVRLAESFAFLPDSKNGEPRPIFLPPHLVAELANHPRGLDRGEQALFKFTKGSKVYSLLRAAAERAGVTLPKRQAFHIFCHTWATWMRRYGGLDTAGLVGTGRWKDRKSAARYEHVVASEEALRAGLLPTPKAKVSGA